MQSSYTGTSNCCL